MGAWIEIAFFKKRLTQSLVAPLVGAWIEITSLTQDVCNILVAPLVGAWIEITFCLRYFVSQNRRSPRGSVD